MATELSRCPWCQGVSDDYLAYHDDEWGVPARDDETQFEFLILEGAQAGLSWRTILHRREGYRRAFAGFDVERVARFNRRSVERLVQDSRIIRNRLKIESAITNARLFIKLQEEFGSFSDFIWSFVDGQPVQNCWRRQQDLPATSTISDHLSKELKRRGFRFVGSTIMYAHMQATGLVNDHIVSCYRHQQCAEMADK